MQGQNMRAEVSGTSPAIVLGSSQDHTSGRTAAGGDMSDGGAGVDHEGAWAREEQAVSC